MPVTSAARAVRRSARIPADHAALLGVRDALTDALTVCDWTREEAFRVLVCADEAFANALSHGSASGSPIDIRFTVGGHRAVLLVGDARARTAPIQTPTTPPTETSENGRGLLLMHALADVFRVWRRPAGTLVALAFCCG